MQRLFLPATTKPITAAYSFENKENNYARFRPKWSVNFAIAALHKAGIEFNQASGKWVGLNDRDTPIVVSIGSGAGSDAEAFLAAGCIVYGVEPNAALRELASHLNVKYPGRFFSIDGNAHQLNLPTDLVADLIVCAQALHTFAEKINSIRGSESQARQVWKKILPIDNRERVSIWYYNLDPRSLSIVELDKLLRVTCSSYRKSKTPLVDAIMFEPKEFQHYIYLADMNISTAQVVGSLVLSFDGAIAWLQSYSFYPMNKHEEINLIKALKVWFDAHKITSDAIKINYIGYITQGPLRAAPYLDCVQHIMPERSPISSVAIKEFSTGKQFWEEKPLRIRFISCL